MSSVLPFILLFAAACGLAYIREIDRLERDCEPVRSGKRFLVIAFCALGLSFLFALLSVDAGLILLTLSLYTIDLLAGIAAGQRLAWAVYCKRNPDLFEEEE